MYDYHVPVTNLTHLQPLPGIYPPQRRATRRKRGPYNKEKTRRDRELEASLKSLGLKSLELTDPFGAHNINIPSTPEDSPANGAVDNPLNMDTAGAIAQRANALHGIKFHETTAKRSPDQTHAMPSVPQWPVVPPYVRFDPPAVTLVDSHCNQATKSITMQPSASYGPLIPHYHCPEQSYNNNCLENQHDLIFGSPMMTTMSLYSLHPHSSQILEYWQIFTENIDPVTKVLHVPSFGRYIMNARLNLLIIDAGLEALMFAIYFAAVTSLSPSECQMRFGEEKDMLVTRYKGTVEKALGKSNLLTSQELTKLQALTLYLVSF